MTPSLARVLIVGGLVLAAASTSSPQEKTVKDDVGNVFILGAPPRRIVSLAPNITEILFALGLGENIVGVTRYCDYPPQALIKEKIGGFIDPDVERIKALDPDLVIAYRGNPWDVLNRLAALRLRVFILDIGTRIEAVPHAVEKIGSITRRVAEAGRLIQALSGKCQKDIEALTPATTRPKVFLNLQGMGLMTCGRPSYLHDLLERAKGENIAGRFGQQWLEYSREKFIEDDPEIIIVLSKSESDFERARDWYKSQPGFESVRAVKSGRIYHLDENSASRFGPRLYDAFAALARLIHPERFRNSVIDNSLPKIGLNRRVILSTPTGHLSEIELW
jgi:iron complex transport system substrate-binding protein